MATSYRTICHFGLGFHQTQPSKYLTLRSPVSLSFLFPLFSSSMCIRCFYSSSPRFSFIFILFGRLYMLFSRSLSLIRSPDSLLLQCRCRSHLRRCHRFCLYFPFHNHIKLIWKFWVKLKLFSSLKVCWILISFVHGWAFLHYRTVEHFFFCAVSHSISCLVHWESHLRIFFSAHSLIVSLAAFLSSALSLAL